MKKIMMAVGAVFTAALLYGWWAFYLESRIQGDWVAVFDVDPSVQNVRQIEYVRLNILQDRTLVYEIATRKVINTIDSSPTVSSTAKGHTSSKRVLNGTYSLRGQRLSVVFPSREGNVGEFDPFVIDNFGTDHKTGRFYVRASLKVQPKGDQLIVQGYEHGPKVTLNNIRNGEEGFFNAFLFQPRGDSSVTAQHAQGREVVSMEKRATDSMGDTWGNERKTVSPKAVPQEEYIPYVPVSTAKKSVENDLSMQNTDDKAEDLILMRSTLRTLSTAAETFAMVHQGQYPLVITDLTEADRPYLSKEYCEDWIAGFFYECRFSLNGYEITASSVKSDQVYAITTGGILVQRQ